MKKNLLLIILIYSGCFGLFAQNYQTVNSGRISYYTTSGNNFLYSKIDSVSFNGDSVLYPNRCFGNVPSESYGTYSIDLISWFGYKIIIRGNGANVYLNSDNDSIVVMTNAKLNDKWIAYKKSNSVIIEAEIVGHDTASVLGQIDSIKTIWFHELDSFGQLREKGFSYEAKFSKSYGWTKTIDFYNLPLFTTTYNLIGITNPRLGIQNLTWFEVYDFQPGDIFHVEDKQVDCLDDGTNITQKIIYRYLKRTDYADSIVYIVDRDLRKYDFYDLEKFIHLHDTIRQVIVDNPNFNKLSEEPIFFEDSFYFCVNYQRIINGQIEKDFIESLCFVDSSHDQYWYLMNFEGGKGVKYFKGLGGYRFYWALFLPCLKDNLELIYYKKGNINWGTPFDFTDTHVLNNRKLIQVYPNPTSTAITVEVAARSVPLRFEIYSTHGEIILSGNIETRKQTIDLRSIERGIYFYKVFSASTIIQTGKLTLIPY